VVRLAGPARVDEGERLRHFPCRRSSSPGRTGVRGAASGMRTRREGGQGTMRETKASSSAALGTQYSVLSTPRSSPARPFVLPFPRLVPAHLTVGLHFACYFPLDCGWLAWLALVPMLCLVRSGASQKRVFFCAWAGGLLFFVPVLQWMRVAA